MNATEPDVIDVRPASETPRPNNGRRAVVAAAVVLAALAFIVSKGLGDATVYFKTADEAVAERDELGERRFRVEGLVTEPVSQQGDDVRFKIMSAGICVDVRHRGDPPELFKPGIPVVLEGQWHGRVYESDRIMVRHSNEYKEKNAGRLDQAASEEYASCSSDGETAAGSTP